MDKKLQVSDKKSNTATSSEKKEESVELGPEKSRDTCPNKKLLLTEEMDKKMRFPEEMDETVTLMDKKLRLKEEMDKTATLLDKKLQVSDKKSNTATSSDKKEEIVEIGPEKNHATCPNKNLLLTEEMDKKMRLPEEVDKTVTLMDKKMHFSGKKSKTVTCPEKKEEMLGQEYHGAALTDKNMHFSKEIKKTATLVDKKWQFCDKKSKTVTLPEKTEEPLGQKSKIADHGDCGIKVDKPDKKGSKETNRTATFLDKKSQNDKKSQSRGKSGDPKAKKPKGGRILSVKNKYMDIKKFLVKKGPNTLNLSTNVQKNGPESDEERLKEGSDEVGSYKNLGPECQTMNTFGKCSPDHQKYSVEKKVFSAPKTSKETTEVLSSYKKNKKKLGLNDLNGRNQQVLEPEKVEGILESEKYFHHKCLRNLEGLPKEIPVCANGQSFILNCSSNKKSPQILKIPN